MVFTPLNENNIRLKFKDSEVKVLSGDISKRGLGYKGTIKIKDEQYKVYGKSCGIPNCNCDAKIIKVNKMNELQKNILGEYIISNRNEEELIELYHSFCEDAETDIFKPNKDDIPSMRASLKNALKQLDKL